MQEALLRKHPAKTAPSIADLEDPPQLQPLPTVIISEDVVLEAAKELRGSAGPSGTDGKDLHWSLCRLGNASSALRSAIADLVSAMANKVLPWEALRGYMASRLIAIDKNPGVRPIGVGEIWRRLFAKVFLRSLGDAPAELCGNKQLCCSTPAGVEGAIHAARILWNEKASNTNFGFLMLDADNAFNKLNRVKALNTIRNIYPAAARMAFNCYREDADLFLRNQHGSSELLSSAEGVTQGDPLGMLLYGLATLPLIDELSQACPDLQQFWYADDGSAGGNLEKLRALLSEVESKGPKYGYMVSPHKCKLVVRPQCLQAAKAIFADTSVQIVEGNRFLGSYLGSDALTSEFVEAKVEMWKDAVDTHVWASAKKTQCAWTTFTKSLLPEMTFLQRVLPDIGPAFTPIEEMISEELIPSLMGLPKAACPPRRLTALPIRHYGLGLSDLSTSSDAQFESSMTQTSHLTASLHPDGPAFELPQHAARVKQGQKVRRKTAEEAHREELDYLTGNQTDLLSAMQKRCATKKGTGHWLAAFATAADDFILSNEEFRTAMCMRYAIAPPNLPATCDGCQAPFTVEHALRCNVGNSIGNRHDSIRDELYDWACAAWPLSGVRREPLDMPSSDTTGGMKRCDVGIRGLFKRDIWTYIDVTVVNTEGKSLAKVTPDKALENAERAKRRHHKDDLFVSRRHFSPFALSTDGLLSPAAVTVVRRIAAKISQRKGIAYSVLVARIRAGISFALARAVFDNLFGERRRVGRHPRGFGEGIGLNAFRW